MGQCSAAESEDVLPKRPPTLGVIVTEEMYQALKEESAKNFNAPISALVRQAIEDWLRVRGHDVQADVKPWGGARDRSEADEAESSGERVPVPA